jgi:hypothetical protein
VTRSISRRRLFRSLALVERIDVPREATPGRAGFSWLLLLRRRRRRLNLLEQLQLLLEQLDLLPKVSPLDRRAGRLGLPPVALLPSESAILLGLLMGRAKRCLGCHLRLRRDLGTHALRMHRCGRCMRLGGGLLEGMARLLKMGRPARSRVREREGLIDSLHCSLFAARRRPRERRLERGRLRLERLSGTIRGATSDALLIQLA